MKNILVPTDFSACADNAVNFAVQSAKIFAANILLAHAFELEGDVYTDYMGVNREFNQSQMEEAAEKLSRLKKDIEKEESIVVDTIVFTGRVKETILHLTSEKNIELVIMGTAGANGFVQKLWGSKTSAIIGKSLVPVLAVPEEYQWKKPAKILLATNHFETTPALLEVIFELAHCYHAEVQVAVFTDEADDTAITFLEHARKIPLYEQTLKEKYPGDIISVAHIFGTYFEHAIQDFISQNEIDLLAMVTYQRSFADKIFHPSITKQMSYHSKIPLLAIPSKPE